jgi:hypothetical protein
MAAAAMKYLRKSERMASVATARSGSQTAEIEGKPFFKGLFVN